MPSSQPENQLDNDKDLRQEILYEFLNQFKEDKYLSQGNTDKAVGAIDQYTQSKLKAFAGELESTMKEVEIPWPVDIFGEVPQEDWHKIDEFAKTLGYRIDTISATLMRRGWKNHQRELKESLKAIKERWNI